MPVQGRVCARIRIDAHLAPAKLRTDGGEIPKPRAVDDKAVEGIADAYPSGLGIIDYKGTFLQVTVLIKIGVADTCTCLDDRYAGVVTHVIDESGTASRDDEVHYADGAKKSIAGLVACRQQGAGSGVNPLAFERGAYYRSDRLVGAERVGPSLEDGNVAASQAEREHIRGHIRPCLVNHAYHSERNADLPDNHTVGAHAAAEFFAQRAWQRGHILHV